MYHVITRVVAGEMLLDAGAKEVLRRLLRRVAAFSGVEVLTYCLMTNHLHILVRVPSVEVGAVERGELARRYALLYPDGHGGLFPEATRMAEILAEDSEEALRWEGRLCARMHDISGFMKTLKQRFSWWYNRSHKRFGTLWAERFKSMIVEDSPEALTVVAAYIDLNPVRAGLTVDPGDYRWSGYGEAMGGEACARAGLAALIGLPDWVEGLAAYRMILFGKGAHGRDGEQGGIPRERVLKVLEAGGKVPIADLLRCRIRYLTDGGVLGSEEFVREVIATRGDSRRKPADRHVLGKLPASDVKRLRVWRRLQVRLAG